ncbi:MAG: NTP transferase domain-containing protein [Planctomycetaceae bacterium]|nr:NTP transferase domain-containing protein [Planctomycetaceae bacterium]
MGATRPIALVVLAAGASARLGEPKALVDLDGQSALARLLRAGHALWDGAAPGELPVVVTGGHHGPIQSHLDALAATGGPRARALFHPAWATGRTGGLALAQAQLPGRVLCVAPVDVPLVGGPVFAALAREFAAKGSPPRGWLAPAAQRGGSLRAGHPIVLGPELAAALGSMGTDEPLRHLRDRAEPRWTLPVDDPAVLDDLDNPEDLERLRQRLRAPRSPQSGP